LLAVGQPGDLLRELLVPQLPAQPRGELFGDLRRSAAELAINGDNADHYQSSFSPRRRRDAEK
jgi:hypothetical protein